jgi:hypothetical protein
VRGRKLIRIKELSRCRRPAFKFNAIPGGYPFLTETAVTALSLCGTEGGRKKAAYSNCSYFFHIKNPPSKK